MKRTRTTPCPISSFLMFNGEVSLDMQRRIGSSKRGQNRKASVDTLVRGDHVLSLVHEALAATVPHKIHGVMRFDKRLQFSSLGIDSIELREIAAYIERRLGLYFPDEELARISKLEQLIRLANKSAKEKQALGGV
jgi:acyl carrier protein